jgi:hypothetical protein
LAARASVLDQALPPSYVAALRVAETIGLPEELLDADGMAERTAELHEAGPAATRYVAFAVVEGRLICFDKRNAAPDGELAVCLWGQRNASPLARNYGEWLDSIADEREGRMAEAADIPGRLRNLLQELGFTFAHPLLGSVHTSDWQAIEELIGAEAVRATRGSAGRLFDHTGKALLTLNLDDFSLTVRLRTGVVSLLAEDVFRWLRSFRDENFFSDGSSMPPPARPDSTRDLRRTPREPSTGMTGKVELSGLGSKKHQVVWSAGATSEDVYLLMRAPQKKESVLVRVQHDTVVEARTYGEEFNQIHVTKSGVLWGLSATHAFRIDGVQLERFPLARATRGPLFWRGIGGDGDDVHVWGAGALLRFEHGGFAPFPEEMGLDPAESVVALIQGGRELSALVCRDGMGAVAHFDGQQWLPVTEARVIEGALIDLDVRRGVDEVLEATTPALHVIGPEADARPTLVALTKDRAFKGSAGMRRVYGMRNHKHMRVYAVEGGFCVTGLESEGIFCEAPRAQPLFEPRVVRIGHAAATKPLRSAAQVDEEALPLMCLFGPYAWMFRDGDLHALDLRAF